MSLFLSSLSEYIRTLGTTGALMSGKVTPEEIQLGAITETWLARHGGKRTLKNMANYSKSSTEIICRAAAGAIAED